MTAKKSLFESGTGVVQGPGESGWYWIKFGDELYEYQSCGSVKLNKGDKVEVIIIDEGIVEVIA